MKKYILSGVMILSLVMPVVSLAQSDVDTSGDAACATISINLRYGARDASIGGAVSILQDFLNSHGYLSVQPTGFFGSMTRVAVAAFQNANGISATPPGFVGPVTRARIQAVDCNNETSVIPPVTTPTPTPTYTGCAGGATYNTVTGQPCNGTIKPVDNGTVYFSSTFFDYGYTIGDPVSGTYNQQLIVTNGSNSNVDVKISMDNQPSWLNTGYSTNTLTINSGQPLGIGVSVNPTGLSAGTYKTEIKVSGNFSGSPKTIPVTLRVYGGSVPVTQSLNITNPLDGHTWTVGDAQTFRWTTTGITSGATGYIDLVDSYGVIHRISNVPNTGSYTWTNVGTINGSAIPTAPTAGNYAVKIIMNNIGDIVGPLTIKEKQSQPITIGTTFSLTGFDGQYKKYVLYLSGGTTANPVKWWTLNFTCSSNVPEVIAKVAGNVCDGQPYQLGYENNGTGDIEVPLNILYTDFNVADLKIHIKAAGKDGGTMGEKDYVLPVHKG